MLDISRDELQTLLAETQLRRYERKLTDVRCKDIMSRQLVTVEFGTSLLEAWALLRERGIKALPVVDRSMRIAQIMALTDLLRAAELELYEGFDEKLRKLIRDTRLATQVSLRWWVRSWVLATKNFPPLLQA